MENKADHGTINAHAMKANRGAIIEWLLCDTEGRIMSVIAPSNHEWHKLFSLRLKLQ